MLMVNKVWGKHTTLAKNISSSDKTLSLPIGIGVGFKSADDGHYYITLRNGSVREVVKVVGRVGDTLTVERGQDNTVAQTFPTGACVDVEWNPQQLCEYIQQCSTGDTAKIKAGTVCITCNTCIEYDEGGHLISVNGAKQC